MLVFGWSFENLTLASVLITLGAKALTERFFWKHIFSKEMDSENINGWRSLISIHALLSTSRIKRSIIDSLMDITSDVWLIYLAFKVSVPVSWLFLVYLGSQAVAAPIQGIIADRFARYRLVSMIITAFAVMTSLGVNDVQTQTLHVQAFGLDNFSKSTQMLLVIGIKGLLSGTAVMARASIADCIQE
ncbi:MAG: hypothetical protein ACHQT8_07260, partial [Chlamydiales bacterium]